VGFYLLERATGEIIFRDERDLTNPKLPEKIKTGAPLKTPVYKFIFSK